MKKLISLLISSKTTLVLLIIFTISIAAATFIEDKYDTITAKLLVYNAKWFEFVILLLVLNFIGSIKRYHLYRKGKLPGLLFHSAFIIIILGAAVTRYIGFEGSMHIRQGESSNFIYSSDPYLTLRALDDGYQYTVDKPYVISPFRKKSFDIKIETKNKGAIKVKFNDFIKNAVETYETDTDGGINIVKLMFSVDGHKDEIILKNGEIKETHGFLVSLNNEDNPNGLNLYTREDNLEMRYPGNIFITKMPEMTVDSVNQDAIIPIHKSYLYEPEGTGLTFVLTNHFKNAKIKYVAGGEGANGPDVLMVDVEYNGTKQTVPVIGGAGYSDNYKNINLDGISLKIAYGMKKIELPFSLKLNEFIMERYAGSESPSSYASEVTLIDNEKGVKKDYRIFMNNVLDYRGYRFFQSSYDQDEKGTILSVNHDFWGTWISYFGYFLLALGFILTLFNKHSRYHDLFHKIGNIRAKRRKAALLMILGIMFFDNNVINAQNDGHIHDFEIGHVSEQHAKKLGELIVQGYDGRFEPVNTLAYDVLHKISKKDKFEVPEAGKMNAMQVFLDMIIHAEFWKKQKIVYVKESAVMNVVGLSGKYGAFIDFFNEDGSYKLMKFAETAFRKKPAEQNKFDKEIIKLNERLEVFMMAYQGKMLKVFPVQNDPNHKWINWTDPLSKEELTGDLRMLNDAMGLEEFNYMNIMKLYLTSVLNATKTSDYSEADKIIGYLDNIQRQSSAASLLPSKSKVKKEIQYNNSKIFINLKNIYALLSVILLLLTFIDNVRIKKNKILGYTLNFFIVILGLAFIYHTYGLGLRWYLSGHAPWSNGYEALILISWASLLAGFSFMRYSKITLAATALLAFFTLMTASHSSYDPQLTNLQPVLKSYWLIIHVATLTISYGFLGLGFILGLIIMFIFLFKSEKNTNRFDTLIAELTHINEMNLTIGLFLATVGTFLGGIWASESWGRYWGWDAKETWSLVIIITYTIILHLRLVPKIRGMYLFNVGAVTGIASVLMTFFGVNYYLSKGLHSYASGETPIFPIWAWITIISILTLIIAAGVKNKMTKKHKPTIQNQ
jgi:cytochrome c-type biogenesis protein CcsB